MSIFLCYNLPRGNFLKNMEDVRVEDLTKNSVLVLPVGYLERSLGQKIKEAVKLILAQGNKNVVISFAEVTRVNSLGMSELIDTFDLIDSGGAEMWFVDVRSDVLAILEAAGLLNLVSQILTLAEAKERLK